MTPEVRDCICHNDHCSRQSSVLSTGWQSVVMVNVPYKPQYE